MTAVPRVGLVGLGNMGRGLARNLDDSGLLAAAWDLHPPAVQACPLSDGVARGGALDVAACDVVLLAVPGSAQIGALFDDGLLEHGAATKVVVDLTTSAPKATLQLAERAARAGAAYLDAGMTGGAAGAAAGRLTLMVGGGAAELEHARPALEAVAERIFHVGGTGAGHSMKLVHNMICHTIFLATAEGCRAAERAGIPLSDALAVINAGNARSFVSERRFVDSVLSQSFDGRSPVANLSKDLDMAAELFEGVGQPSCYVGLTASLLAAAESSGMADTDFTRLYPEYDALVDRLRGTGGTG